MDVQTLQWYGTFVRAEFGWTGRTARQLMAITERFGPRTDMISDLNMQPTGAYLLAAPAASAYPGLRDAKVSEPLTAPAE